MHKFKIKKRKIYVLVIVGLITLLLFQINPVKANETESRPITPDGPSHTNELTNLITCDETIYVLIVTEGWGPLTGITPFQDRDLWYEVLGELGGFQVDWYDGIPTFERLNNYDLVIYDAGGYWYPLSHCVSPLTQYHLTGKPLIVVAPDINYDWGMGYLDSSFVEDVLHIEGALGIMPDSEYDVFAGTGHPIESGLPYLLHIPPYTSYPDCFDAKDDAEYALVQNFVLTTEFGVGTAADLPSYSYYTPLGYHSIVAYPGSPTEGKVVTIGFPVAGLSPFRSKPLCANIIEWSIGELTSKQKLIHELKTLKEEACNAIDSFIDKVAHLHATEYKKTREDWWETGLKFLLEFLAGKISAEYLKSMIPKLYEIYVFLKPLADASTVGRLHDAFVILYEDLDPDLDYEIIKGRFKNALLYDVPFKSFDNINHFKTHLNDLLMNLINKIEQMPEDYDYELMATEVKNARKWMETIQDKEKTIEYINITHEKVIDARTAGGLSDYIEKLDDTLEKFKFVNTISTIATFFTFGGFVIKKVGWYLVASVATTIVTELVGGFMMAGGTGVNAIASTAELGLFLALAHIEAEADTCLINDIKSIRDVYIATLDLIENWEEKGDFIGECEGLELNQDTFAVTPTDISLFVGPECVPHFFTNIKGTISLSSQDVCKGRVILEIYEQEHDTLRSIIGYELDLQPGTCSVLPFEIPLCHYLQNYEKEKLFRVVAYIAIGTTLYGPISKQFRVILDDAISNQMITNSISSSIETGESFSTIISTNAGTTDLYISIDYPGSELDLHLFDSAGNHVGLDYVTGNVELNIPNAYYSGSDVNPEWISIEGDVGKEEFLIRASCVYAEGEEPFSLAYSVVGDSLKIEPAKQVGIPGETAIYKVYLKNFEEEEKTFDLSLVGLDPEWFSFSPISVTLNPNSEAIILLEITPPYEADIGDYPFTVSASGILGSVTATLELIIPATIDFDPDTLNLKSKGKWITVYIELREDFDVSNIDIATIVLNDQIKTEISHSEIGDFDGDGILDLMVKFSLKEVQELLDAGDNVRISIHGKLDDGSEFKGIDYIRVINPLERKTELIFTSIISNTPLFDLPFLSISLIGIGLLLMIQKKKKNSI